MTDRRKEGLQFPVASHAFAQASWAAAESGAIAKTLDNLNGTLGSIEIVVPDTTNGITFTVTITSATGATLYTEAGLADNQTHYKTAYSNKGTQDADFNPALMNSTITCTVTPSGVPGATGATADVTIYFN